MCKDDLVDSLQQPWTHLTMNLNCNIDELFPNLVFCH